MNPHSSHPQPEAIMPIQIRKVTIETTVRDRIIRVYVPEGGCDIVGPDGCIENDGLTNGEVYEAAKAAREVLFNLMTKLA